MGSIRRATNFSAGAVFSAIALLAILVSPSAAAAPGARMITLLKRVNRDGFAFVAADDMRLQLDDCGVLSDWRRFAESWNDLQLERICPTAIGIVAAAMQHCRRARVKTQ